MMRGEETREGWVERLPGSSPVPAVATSDEPSPRAAASGRELVTIADISKAFGTREKGLVALQNINLSLVEGEFVTLVGPSGCGKSTLLKIVAGLLSATRGEVKLDGARIDGPRRDIGLMFQTATLFPWRTVKRNIMLPFDIARDRAVDREARVREVLELTGLEGFEEHYPRQLSGGMQQRVALCRLLVSDPNLMLLDEPFGALDEFTRERLNVELARISEIERKTTIFVTHNISEAVFLSDRVVVMGTRPGRVLDIVDIDLPRPRRSDVIGTHAYSDRLYEVRQILGLG
jgi:NitT/TauT family transport system ATP-binding protein